MKKENLGVEPDEDILKVLIDEMKDDGAIEQLSDVEPQTLTITVKGIEEYAGLNDVVKEKLPLYQFRHR